MSKTKRITSDVYDIADRLKEIDPSYYIVYNTVRNRYEVHSANNIHDTLCLISPYKQLDQRLLTLVWETRREKAKQIFKEMEKNNADIERKAAAASGEKSRAVLSEIERHAKGGDLTFSQTEEIKRRCLGVDA